MLFCSITQIGLENYLQREFRGKDKEGRIALTKAFVQSVIYRYLASVESGVDYDEAKKLAEKARIEEVLQCTKLGGKREWKLDEFLDEDVWEELGGKAGLREQAIKFLTYAHRSRWPQAAHQPDLPGMRRPQVRSYGRPAQPHPPPLRVRHRGG